eukprot:COSAG02_NODE_343_length_24147_cov_30.662051_15_plen_94_part_00
MHASGIRRARGPRRRLCDTTVVREELIHGHGLTHRARLAHRRGKLGALWRDALVAWDKVKVSLTLAEPQTALEVLDLDPADAWRQFWPKRHAL